MTDRDVRDFLERMAAEESIPVFDVRLVLDRRIRRPTRPRRGTARAVLLVLLPREQEEDDDRAEHDRDDAPPRCTPSQRRRGMTAWRRVIASAYFGCCCATVSALANDFVSCDWMPSVMRF